MLFQLLLDKGYDFFFIFPRSMLPIFENDIKDIECKMTHEKNYETIFKFERIK